MRATEAALCTGEVWHRRNYPTVNEFTYPASHVWIDPDHPEQLTHHSPLWSATTFAPARFRRSDYGADPNGSLGDQLRDSVDLELGFRPHGPIRMLSQVRRLGWLFNPITLFVLWHDDPDHPVAAIAEVTNTPWKERTQYVLAIDSVPHPSGDPGATAFSTEFNKELHVSPFLNMDYDYRLTIMSNEPELLIRIDVLDSDGSAILETALTVERIAPTPTVLNRSAALDGFRTRQVSAGIHAQAAKLAAKRVAFVPHPRKSTSKKEVPR